MQQDSRPSWAEHDFHLACGRLARIELNDGLPRCFDGKVLRRFLGQEVVERHTSAAASAAARRACALRLGDAEDAHARHWLSIFGEAAVRTDDEDTPQLV